VCVGWSQQDRGERFLLGRVHFLSLARDFLHLRVGSDGTYGEVATSVRGFYVVLLAAGFDGEELAS
jgi:hypothetical protein